ncbi:hypothetical protein [Bradyrhizobium sp.]|uniref:hypothetical protein n=1 Tax=Bradyrhizobium sp. TaxID=376 RepID=UPI002612D72E|nr:hypothetical protein [Bradyrhizobium sp.]
MFAAGWGTNVKSALLVRRFAAATAFSLITAGLFQISPAAAASDACADVTVLPAPFSPWTGAALRVMVIAGKPLAGTLSLIAPDGSVAARSADRHEGPPFSWFAEVAHPAAGSWRATLEGTPAGCAPVSRDITVAARRPEPFRIPAGMIWPTRNNWNSTSEALFSAWIEKLFDAPPDEDLNWKVWYEVLRDPKRNFLSNYLGRNEDVTQTGLRPDCADFVYFLRAYFAFKMGLPFGYSSCSRGGGGRPPRCGEWFDVEHPEVTRPPPPPDQVAAAQAAEAPPPPPPPARTSSLLRLFGQSDAPAEQPAAALSAMPPPPKPQRPTNFAQYLRDVGDVVHTGAVRAGDDRADFYTVPLTREALRPGTVYADPYGHVLMLVRRVPEVKGTPGVFLAVDAEPDGSITRKRFWRGNFLFVHEPALGTPGFKHFRPILRDKNGPLHRPSNAEINRNPQFADFSAEQSQMPAEDFYDRMDDVMSPEPLDPVRAMEDAIASLSEQIRTRVTAVENGRKFQIKQRGDTSMPEGASIFQASGAWEDFSTPARDLRLLIAIDVVRNFPARFARRADRYALPPGKSVTEVKNELQAALASELASRKVTYTRSDGSQWTLSVKDVVDRATDLEMAYNPNDCVELRWGAAENSDEASTCRRHAPRAQRTRMSNYRPWFRDRHWPSHT